MQIFVDADACPVVDIVESIAEKYNIKTTLLCDTNHVLYSDYSEVIVVGAGADAVDYKLISLCHRGDIVVSQDYGVAAMALGKGAYAIHQSGRWYTDENIDRMLMERHLNKKVRRSSHKNHIRGPKKRTEKDDERFASVNLADNKNIFLICTYGGRPVFKSIEQVIAYKHDTIVGMFSCKGFDTFGPFKLIGGVSKGHPDEKDVAAAVEFYNRLKLKYD